LQTAKSELAGGGGRKGGATERGTRGVAGRKSRLSLRPICGTARRVVLLDIVTVRRAREK